MTQVANENPGRWRLRLTRWVELAAGVVGAIAGGIYLLVGPALVLEAAYVAASLAGQWLGAAPLPYTSGPQATTLALFIALIALLAAMEQTKRARNVVHIVRQTIAADRATRSAMTQTVVEGMIARGLLDKRIEKVALDLRQRGRLQ